MAWTARSGEDLVEYIESAEELQAHAEQLADLIRDAQHLVCYTGAGISCSAGIPDFRGPKGVWTLAAEGKKAEMKVSTLQAVPTAAHMALVELQNRGKMKHLISSNCDGLHVRSGIEPANITEVHGNSNLEECQDCGRKFYRDYPTRARLTQAVIASLKLTGRAVHHFTGRFCVCGGPLCDTIINFGENLSAKAIEDGFFHGEKADVLIAMGASLTVSPSCNMVEAVKKKKRGEGKLVIINLQKTPYDDIADLRIFAKTDDIWKRTMDILGFPIPEFLLRRRVSLFPSEGKNGKVNVLGIAADGTPNAWFKAVARVKGKEILSQHEPQESVQLVTLPAFDCDLVLFPFGHYSEPPVCLDRNVVGHGLPAVISLVYSPSESRWIQIEPEMDATRKTDDIRDLLGATGREKEKDANLDSADDIPVGGGFAVYPKTDCPHIDLLHLDGLTVDTSSPCLGCLDVKENWMCLKCNAVHCSRYRNGCMVKHVEEECHEAVLASFSDFSFWCPSCDSYIVANKLGPVKKAMELSKFGSK